MAAGVKLLKCIWRHAARSAMKPCTSVSLLMASACATEESKLNSANIQPLKLVDKKEMTHEALIRQACTMTANSSSQLLTQVLIAISETSQGYRIAMSQLLVLLEESLLLLSNSRSTLDEVEDMIVEQRSIVEEQHRLIMELVSLMNYVEKMVTSTAETAYLAGAEQSSTLMCERLNSALNKVEEECAANKQSEDELLKLQQLYVIKLGELYEREWNGQEQDQSKVGKEDSGSPVTPIDIFESSSLDETEGLKNDPKLLV